MIPGSPRSLHAIVGGTPAYRRQFVRDDAPVGPDDFDDWVVRSVLNPDRPLLREARYLLAEEMDIRDPALYHSVLAAIAARNEWGGGIASYIGRKDIRHRAPAHRAGRRLLGGPGRPTSSGPGGGRAITSPSR